MNQIQLTTRVIKPLVFVLSLLPFGFLVWGAWLDALGANPVETITLETGQWGLRFLLITLAITPIRRLSSWHSAIRLRRMLGLFAFFYVVVHFTTFVWLDHFFSFDEIVEDIVERPFVTAGFTALVMLVPLAATSTDAMIKRLGGKNWRRLHRLIYLAVGAAVLHFLWLVKADLREPLIYLGIALALMALRWPGVAGRLRSWRNVRAGRASPSAPGPEGAS